MGMSIRCEATLNSRKDTLYEIARMCRGSPELYLRSDDEMLGYGECGDFGINGDFSLTDLASVPVCPAGGPDGF